MTERGLLEPNHSDMARPSPLRAELSLITCSSLMFQNLDHGGKLEKDIMGDTSGNYQKLLLMLLQVNDVNNVFFNIGIYYSLTDYII